MPTAARLATGGVYRSLVVDLAGVAADLEEAVVLAGVVSLFISIGGPLRPTATAAPGLTGSQLPMWSFACARCVTASLVVPRPVQPPSPCVAAVVPGVCTATVVHGHYYKTPYFYGFKRAILVKI